MNQIITASLLTTLVLETLIYRGVDVTIFFYHESLLLRNIIAFLIEILGSYYASVQVAKCQFNSRFHQHYESKS